MASRGCERAEGRVGVGEGLRWARRPWRLKGAGEGGGLEERSWRAKEGLRQT